MANKYATGYKAAYVTVPYTPYGPGGRFGRLRCLYDQYDLGDDAALLATADTLYMAKIPNGMRVIECWLKFGDLGTTGQIDVGWAASSDAVEAADATGFFSNINVESAADVLLSSQDDAAPVGIMKKFAAEVNVVIAIDTATTAVDGNIDLAIMGIID